MRSRSPGASATVARPGSSSTLPSARRQRLRPRAPGPPPARPKGATLRRSERIDAVTGAVNSSSRTQAVAAREAPRPARAVPQREAAHDHGRARLQHLGIGDARVGHVHVHARGAREAGARARAAADRLVVAEARVAEGEVVHGALARGGAAHRARAARPPRAARSRRCRPPPPRPPAGRAASRAALRSRPARGSRRSAGCARRRGSAARRSPPTRRPRAARSGCPPWRRRCR